MFHPEAVGKMSTALRWRKSRLFGLMNLDCCFEGLT
jgi:hypothetical protein